MAAWSDDELAHVFLLVDHCRDHNTFKDTVEGFLVQQGFASRSYGAIDTKLCRSKEKSGVPGRPHTKVLLEKGTDILPELKGDSPLAIKFREVKARLAAKYPPAAPVAQNHRENGEGGQNRQVEQGGVEGLPGGQVHAKFASLAADIAKACKTLITHENLYANPETLERMMKSAFGSLWTAWQISNVPESREEFLRALITSHIFDHALASAFPWDSPDVALAREREVLTHMIGTPWFEAAVKAKASVEASEVFLALRMVAYKPEDNAGGPISMPSEVFVERLAPAYRSALRLTAELALTSKHYVAQFISAEQEIDRQTMDIEVPAHGGIDNPARVCLFPIIRASPIPNEAAEVHNGMGNPQIKYPALSVAEFGQEVDGDLVCKGILQA
ncbi:hypothetical protein PG994_000518 [Apiospora phragmitis]|uniref:Uncharacterized protein n=1 Tax=Apiospora phragmitis TaxID=2905665 RepID=A0ABR1X6G0_9PEZI